VQFFGPDTSTTATLESDISLTHRAWRDQSDNGSPHASADRPLDVLIVTSEAPPIISGISTCVARLAGGLTARQHNVRVISSAQIRRVMFGEWRFSSFVAHWPRIARDLRNFDVVNVHGPVPTISDVFLGLSNLLPDHSRPAIVYTYHSPVDVPAAARWARMYDKFHVQLALRADRIIASSQHYARQHYSRYGPVVQAIPWGTDPRVAAVPDRPGGRDELRVLFVGQMRPYKGVQVLLAAAAEQPWLQVTLVGAGPELAAYQRLAERLGVTNARFTGRLSDVELQACYASHDVVVLPSLTRAEAFGLVLLDGMSAGCVPVASDWPGVSDVAGPTGMLVPPGDPVALREALRTLAQDPVHLQRLRVESLQRAKTLTWERCVTAYERVMREAVRGRYARLHGLQTVPDRADRAQTGPLRVVPVQRVGAMSER
jgi:glycosyltransferase involved in cell wall biosynthesis